MSNLLVQNKNNEQLALITNSKGVTGSGKINDNAIVMNLEFTAQNNYTVRKTTIRAVDVKVTEAHFTGDKTEEQILLTRAGNSDNTSQLTPTMENSIVLVNTEDHIAIINEVFNNSYQLEVIKEDYEDSHQYAELSVTHRQGKSCIKMKNGTMTADYFSYKNFVDNKNFHSLELVYNQIRLDSSLSVEHAEIINNELYQKFPLLNNSTPIVTTLNDRTVSQLDLLLSRTYSADPKSATSVTSEVISSYGKHYPVFNDIFAIINLGIAKGADFPVAPSRLYVTLRNTPLDTFRKVFSGEMMDSTILIERSEPLRIIHSNTRAGLDKALDSKAAGVYSEEYNVALFLETGEHAVHEFTHATVNIIFNNNAKPYFPDDENTYHLAVKSFLLNLNAKLGQSNDNLLDLSISSIFHSLRDATILDLLAMSRTPSFSIEKFFSQNNNFSEEIQLDSRELNKWKNKYFKDFVVEDITNEQIKVKLTEEISKLNLTHMEGEVIAKVSMIFYHYTQDLFDIELVAKMAELFYEYDAEPAVEELFAPIYQYWADYIHPLVEKELIIPHQLECSGQVDTNNFVYCVAEYLG